MACDMCGNEGRLFISLIEGTRLTVCEKCSRYGKIINELSQNIQKKTKNVSPPKEPEPELIESFVPDYSELIRRKREQLKLTQEEFAKLVSEKQSIIHKIEAGHFKPSISLGRKLENILRIRLIEEIKYNNINQKTEPSANTEFTLGDFIKVKRK